MIRRATTVALVGAGAAAAVHAAAADALGWRIVAVVTPDPVSDRARRLATRAGAPTVTPSGMPLDVGLVVVATPPWARVDTVTRVLAAGTPVLSETPIAGTPDDAESLLAASRSSAARFVTAAHTLHSPVVRSLVLRAPTLGPLTSLEFRLFAPRPTWRSHDHGPDALGELGVRALTVLLSLVGDDAPAAVRGASDGARTTVDHARLELRLTSGAVARVEVGWQDRAIEDVQLSSDCGVLRAEIAPDPRLEHNGDPVPTGARGGRGALHELGYVDQLRAVVDAGPSSLLPGAETGAAALRLSALARHAAATGAEVTTSL